MAEGVVVRLEAVEVEYGEHPTLAVTRTPELAREVEEELAPVGESGERIGHCLAPAVLQQLGVLAQRQRSSREDEHDRRSCEGERDRVHGPDSRRGEHPCRQQAADDRRAEQRAILELNARNATGPLPRGERDEDERE